MNQYPFTMITTRVLLVNLLLLSDCKVLIRSSKKSVILIISIRIHRVVKQYPSKHV